jgi:hypothetical protein
MGNVFRRLEKKGEVHVNSEGTLWLFRRGRGAQESQRSFFFVLFHVLLPFPLPSRFTADELLREKGKKKKRRQLLQERCATGVVVVVEA